ncbi:MAG TPA: hypothetical protein VKV23_06125 [Acidimicrobiales bacterium]|nr:hypothetical protein [Acidimicrobiales bacterium]
MADHLASPLAGEAAGACAALLDELAGLIERAKSMPLSTSAIIARDEVLELIGRAREALPAELERARRVLAERDEVRARASLEAEEILSAARAQAAHLVQRTEVVRQAELHAERLLQDAEAEARRIRREADDYVDRKLAAFEIVLDRTMRAVRAGRERLAPSGVDEAAEPAGTTPAGEEHFFDQDRT